MEIRAERPEDADAVFRVQAGAFGREAEARLVDRLRGLEPAVSLVGELGGEVVAHAYFSPVVVTPGATREGAAEAGRRAAMALGPVGVAPGHQRRGAGGALIREGLARCDALGHPVVFVLGHPAYYPRFGFRPAAPALRYRSEAFDGAFFVAELRPGAIRGWSGFVHYAPPFDEVDGEE